MKKQEITNGTCENCTEGIYEDFCNETYIQNCSKNWRGIHICNDKNGFCFECEDGFYGNKCDEKCEENCLENGVNKCYFIDGKCKSCKNGFYGYFVQKNAMKIVVYMVLKM